MKNMIVTIAVIMGIMATGISAKAAQMDPDLYTRCRRIVLQFNQEAPDTQQLLRQLESVEKDADESNVAAMSQFCLDVIEILSIHYGPRNNPKN